MALPKQPVTARLRADLIEKIARESSLRGVSQSATIEAALDRYFIGDDSDTQLHLLRSVFITRELLWDMSNRSDAEKEKLWQSMTDFAKKMLNGDVKSPLHERL